MNIKQTIITAAVALTMVAMIAPMTAGASTATDALQAQINALMAQLNSLQGSATVSTSIPASCVGVTFTRNLTVGATGSDVKCLQSILNLSASTQVSVTGAGSPGYETTYFGAKTLVAVKVWQSQQGFTPANQVGPLSRAKLNAWLSGSTGTPVSGSYPPGCTSSAGYSPTTGQPCSSGTPVTNVTPTGAGLSVALASDTPVSNAVVSNAAIVPLEKITFANGDNAAVTVTGLTLHRIGVSADASLENVYLFNGASRLTDAASVSSGLINFNNPNGLFTVPSQGSVEITVYSDLSANAGETLGTELYQASDVVSNASSVHGPFPINGNLMAVATATLAGVNFSATTTPSTAAISPMDGVVVWENLTSITTRSVLLQWLTLREIGTIDYTDIGNFKLYVDGVMVGQAVPNLDSNGYVTFDLTSAPVTLQTGTRDIKVLADVTGGSSRNFSMSLRVAADIRAEDSQYGANVLAQAASGTFSARTTGTQTINSGTVTLQETSDSPSGNVTNLASNQVLARYTLTAAGEPVKISDLTAAVISSNSAVGCLRNGALFANGVQIGSTHDLYTTTNTTCGSGNPTSWDFQLGSSLIVTPLNPVTLEIRADLYDDDGTNSLTTGNTVQAELIGATDENGQGQVSLVSSEIPNSTITGNALTIATGTLTLSKYTAYTNQTVVAPLTNFMLAHFTLTNSTVEPINLTSIETNLTNIATNANNEYVVYGTQQTTKIPVPTVTSGGNSSDTQSIFYQMAPSSTIDVEVFADIQTTAVSTAKASVLITGTTVNSAQAVNTNSNAVLDGQTITFSTGSATTSIDGSTPLNQVVAGNQSAINAAAYKFTASNDSYTITEAKFTVHGNNGAVINNASLWDGSTLLATMPFDSSNNWFYFTGINDLVPANTTKVLTVSLNLATPYTDGTTITTGKNLALTMSYIKALNSRGAVETNSAGITLTNATGNYIYVYKTVPTFTVGSVSGQGTNLQSGSTTQLYNFTVGADAKGSVALRQLKFSVTTSHNSGSGSTPNLSTFKFLRGSTDLTQAGTVTIMNNATGADITGATSITSATVVVSFYPEEVVPAGSSYTYTLEATPANFSTSTTGSDSVSTYLPGASTPANAAAGADVTTFYLSAAANHSTGATNDIQSLYTAANHGGGDTAANVIWSDNSAKIHDYTDSSTTSSDWFNGYLINNLPLASIGIAAGQ